MTTLTYDKNMSCSEIITKTRDALLEQGVHSCCTEKGMGYCRYRAPQPGGECYKCAVGFWIPESRYDPYLEDKSFKNDVIFIRAICGDYDMSTEHIKLFAEMQKIHDFSTVEQWPNAFAEMLERYSADGEKGSTT